MLDPAAYAKRLWGYIEHHCVVETPGFASLKEKEIKLKHTGQAEDKAAKDKREKDDLERDQVTAKLEGISVEEARKRRLAAKDGGKGKGKGGDDDDDDEDEKKKDKKKK